MPREIWIALLSAFAVSCAPQISPSPVPAAAALDLAIVNGDAAELERLVADDFLWVRGNGEVAGRAEFISALTNPDLELDPIRTTDPRWFRSQEQALFIGSNRLSGALAGEPVIDQHRFADLWLFEAGEWKLVYAQTTGE